MRCLGVLLAVLVVASTSSARRLAKQRRNTDTSKFCFEFEKYPLLKCNAFNPAEKYPTFVSLVNVRNETQLKNFLRAEGTLESVCSEAESFVRCVLDSLSSASAQCLDLYSGGDLTLDHYNNIASLRDQLCTEENFRTVRRHVGCLVDMDVRRAVQPCTVQNPDQDCSETDSEDSAEKGKCYEGKQTNNCDADEVVECAVEKIESECGEEAGELASFVGNAIFDKFPICPDDKRSFKLFRKFFK